MTEKYLKVKDHKGLVRDVESKAILSVDHQALLEHRKKKMFVENLVNNNNKIEKLENDVNEIKEMLTQLLQKI